MQFNLINGGVTPKYTLMYPTTPSTGGEDLYPQTTEIEIDLARKTDTNANHYAISGPVVPACGHPTTGPLPLSPNEYRPIIKNQPRCPGRGAGKARNAREVQMHVCDNIKDGGGGGGGVWGIKSEELHDNDTYNACNAEEMR